MVSRPPYTFTRWMQRHRTLVRLLPHRLVGRLLWREIMADPVAMAGIRQGEADIAAGRWYHLDPKTGETHPNPDWPTDGPQPDHP